METDTPTRGVRPSLFGQTVPTRGASRAPAALPAGTLVRVADGGVWSRTPGKEGLRITALSGHLWITQSGKWADQILKVGERFTARGNGKVVVQAMGDTAFRIEG